MNARYLGISPVLKTCCAVTGQVDKVRRVTGREADEEVGVIRTAHWSGVAPICGSSVNSVQGSL